MISGDSRKFRETWQVDLYYPQSNRMCESTGDNHKAADDG